MDMRLRKLTQYERGVRHFFGKRYMWLLDENNNLGLHKVDDKGDKESMSSLANLEALQKEQSE